MRPLTGRRWLTRQSTMRRSMIPQSTTIRRRVETTAVLRHVITASRAALGEPRYFAALRQLLVRSPARSRGVSISLDLPAAPEAQWSFAPRFSVGTLWPLKWESRRDGAGMAHTYASNFVHCIFSTKDRC